MLDSREGPIMRYAIPLSAALLATGCMAMNASPDPLTRYLCSNVREQQKAYQACMDKAPACVLSGTEMHRYEYNKRLLAACYPREQPKQ